MKKYILITGPILVALFIMLIWVIQSPKQTSQDTTSIQTTPSTTVVKEKITSIPEQEPQNIEPIPIADASNLDTSVLENAEDEEAPEKVIVNDSALLSYLSDNLNSEIGKWLVREHILSKFVRAIHSLEEGELVSKYRPLEMPTQPFVAEKQGELFKLSQANYDRYTPYIQALEAIGEDELINAYHHFYPALENAYKELGVNKGAFDKVTKRAIQQLIDAPELSPPPILTQKSVSFKYQNPQLEALPAAQKLMIRMGPENSIRLKNLLQKLVIQI